MPIQALRFIRKMRGGAQAHLLECTDGNFYVVKFMSNPQHRRILVNEWLGSAFLSYLKIATPDAAVIEVTSEFLAANPEVSCRMGATSIPFEAGWHFGSRYPGDPARLAVYDFLPDQLLDQVANLFDFRGTFVFDKWMGNADSRQCIFFRAQLKEWTHLGGQHPRKVGFVAQMMDNGYVLGGPGWVFSDSSLQGLYFRRNVYRGVASLDDFEPWLEQVKNFPEDVVDAALKQIPPAWIEEDRDAVEALLHRLMARRKRVADLVQEAADARNKPFVAWANSAV